MAHAALRNCIMPPPRQDRRCGGFVPFVLSLHKECRCDDVQSGVPSGSVALMLCSLCRAKLNGSDGTLLCTPTRLHFPFAGYAVLTSGTPMGLRASVQVHEGGAWRQSGESFGQLPHGWFSLRVNHI